MDKKMGFSIWDKHCNNFHSLCMPELDFVFHSDCSSSCQCSLSQDPLSTLPIPPLQSHALPRPSSIAHSSVCVYRECNSMYFLHFAYHYKYCHRTERGKDIIAKQECDNFICMFTVLFRHLEN